MAAVSSRYARAFADVVLERKLNAGKVLLELYSVAQLLAENVQLRQLWDNPAVAAEQKRGVLDALAQKLRLSKPVRNLVAVLLDHRRINHFSNIVRQYEQEMNARLGLAEAEVTSFRELSAAEKRALETKISDVTGKRVRARYGIDPGILGGAIIRVGSTVYDGSVLGQLHKLKERLAAT
jgi:F-type H+-transporting ATPase subunit delta